MFFFSAKGLLFTFVLSAAKSGFAATAYTTVGDTLADEPRVGCFRLTPSQRSKTGAVWATTKIDLSNPFELEIDVYVGNNDRGADGMALVLQNNGPNEIGTGGGGKGYKDIKNALVVELDTWPNGYAERNGDFIQVHTSDRRGRFKSLSNKAFVNNIEDDNEHKLKVTWDGTSELKVWLDDDEPKITLSLPFGLSRYIGGSDEVYYGYTAATGGAHNVHYVCEPEDDEPPSPPGPPVLDTTMLDALADNPREGCFQLTPSQRMKTGAVWASTKIDVTKPFLFETDIYVGHNDRGADGMAFVLQNNGAGVIGMGGGNKGYRGIKNALVVEIDTWPNGYAERNGDFIQVLTSNPWGHFTPISNKAFVDNIEDDNEHKLVVSWDGSSELKIWLDGGDPKLSLSLSSGISDLVGGSTEAYYGYTAATGGAHNVHYICGGDVQANEIEVYRPGSSKPRSGFLDTTVEDAVEHKPKNGCFMLTPAQNYKRGAVWSSSKIDINKAFVFETNVYVGDNDHGADGIAFVLHNNGLATIGEKGGNQGYTGIKNAFVVELDTWKNSAASHGDFIQIWSSNDNGFFSEISSKAMLGFNVEDDNEHTFKVSWDGSKIEVSLDGKLYVSEVLEGGLAQHVGGNNMVHYGYTAATGGANNVHYICEVEAEVNEPNMYEAGGAKERPEDEEYQAGGAKGRIVEPPSSGAKGDPHFKTWDGELYDFHGICDLVLLKNPGFENGLGMDINIRTKKMRQWSFISSAVLRIGGDTFELSGEREQHYWINGVMGEELNSNNMILPMTISGYPIQFIQVNSQQREFIIDLGKGESIVFKTWHNMVRVDVVGATSENFIDSTGLLGSFKDGGLKVARDNTTIFENVNDFGQEWQVLASEPVLFHNIDGPQAPAKCEIPSQTQLRRNLGESKVSLKAAQEACAGVTDQEDFDLCIFDVMATSNIDVAGAY